MNSFNDYMYYLLVTPLKKIERVRNQFSILFKVLGKYFDNAMNMLYKAREQSIVYKADIAFLPEHGKDREMIRYEGESLENYRNRLLMKAVIAEEAGSNKSIKLTLISLGILIPSIKPTFLYDPNRWAEFDIGIDEAYMDVVGLEIIKNEVRKIKQASSRPNYGFILHSDSGCYLGAEVRSINRFFINELGISYIHLDGTYNLDGTFNLDGSINNNKRDYSNTVTNRFTVSNSCSSTAYISIQKDLWVLDGTYNLDGLKELNAINNKEEL